MRRKKKKKRIRCRGLEDEASLSLSITVSTVSRYIERVESLVGNSRIAYESMSLSMQSRRSPGV